MYAQCPECLTVFSLNTETLAQARGEVVCGHCDAVFDALASLSDQLPPEPFQHLPPPRTDLPPRLDLAVYRPPAEMPAVAEAPAPRDVLDEFADLVVAPRFARQTEKKRRWPWITACTLLLLALGAQLGWAERDLLITDNTTGPLLRQACTSLGCELPLVQDTSRLSLVARDVQAHPSVPGALLITANLRNDAPFAQPYPTVSITLSDANGNKLAMRRLRSSEYLGDAAVLQKGIPAGGSAALMLEVEDPGGKAVAFEFGFE
ncbi:zinc-ribbon domain-containing protein [Dyella telluris]|uniref:Zinc-ribbon domain-containing protein n=2 Tax=Dyella telluris TaxID=2763498 RepID=A0A7G8QAD1_9GAMM|nr:zinc-ribbon domain-containing protein [Dyella telluris]